MSVQSGPLFEFLLTGSERTEMRVNLGVYFQVSPEHFLGLEAVTTLVTLMVPDVHMNSMNVTGQSSRLYEGSPTSLTGEVSLLGQMKVD